MKRLIPIVLFLVLSPALGHAGVQESRNAIMRGDFATAFKELLPVAQQGFAAAQNGIGHMHATAKGVARDYAAAARWFRKSAEQGYAYAQYNLGFLYSNGNGVPQDYAEAVKWYRKAAQQEVAHARYTLGIMYDQGKGVPQDNVLAHMWFNLGAAGGDGPAKNGRDRVSSRMTSAQIARAQKLARQWMEKHGGK